MRIAKVDIYPFATERVHTTVTAALGGKEHRVGGVTRSDFGVLRLETTDGAVGWGEISDIPDDMRTREGALADAETLEAYLGRLLLGQDATQRDRLTAGFPDKPLVDQRTDGTVYDIVGCGVDMALLDLAARAAGVPVFRLFGGQVREEVQVSWVIFIRDTALIEQEVAQKVSEGFTAFKLKVGISAKDDEERLRIVRRTAGDGASIKLDANSGWSFDEAVDNMRRFEAYRPAGIETPIPYLDIAGKARLKARIGTPIIEHVNDEAFGLALIRSKAADVFNVCPAGGGGVTKAWKLMRLAEEAGVECLLGSTVEAGLGTAAQLQLAACAGPLTWPSDLVGPKLYTRDYLRRGFDWRGSHLRIPQGVGWGVEVDTGALEPKGAGGQ